MYIWRERRKIYHMATRMYKSWFICKFSTSCCCCCYFERPPHRQSSINTLTKWKQINSHSRETFSTIFYNKKVVLLETKLQFLPACLKILPVGKFLYFCAVVILRCIWNSTGTLKLKIPCLKFNISKRNVSVIPCFILMPLYTKSI